jgi:hypothetical protein
MKKAFIVAVLISGTVCPNAVWAAGCLKGAVAGGVAGHYAHHHAILGAMAGCAVGHHMAVKKERERQRHQGQPAHGSQGNY